MSDFQQRGPSLPMPPVWLSLAVAAACLIAIFVVPYGYFQFLRLLVTGYAGYLAFQYFRSGPTVAAWLFGFLALIFNPVFIIAMSRDVHAIFDIFAAIVIVGELALLREQSESEIPGSTTNETVKGAPLRSENERVELAKFLAREIAMVIGAIILTGSIIGAIIKLGIVDV